MNILDYLDWRGDLPFGVSPPNEVDALIFAWLSYYRFEDLPQDCADGLTLTELSQAHEAVHGPFQKVNFSNAIDTAATAALLLQRASNTQRFASVRISDFSKRDSFDESDETGQKQNMQFASVSFIIDDLGLRVISYRGTDDSIAGWKEDCYLAISETVPVQASALDYLNAAPGGKLLICGHSKGGNLATYAAVFANAEKQGEISAVYNFDGPGFCFDIRSLPGYDAVKDRLVTIVPESSIVGMLLDHVEDYIVVSSKGMGILQHDALFWQVMGAGFVRASGRNSSSLIADKTLKSWIDGMSISERRDFVDSLFSVLESTGAQRTTELPERLVQNWFKNTSHSRLNPEQRKMMTRVLLKLVKAGGTSLYNSVKDQEV